MQKNNENAQSGEDIGEIEEKTPKDGKKNKMITELLDWAKTFAVAIIFFLIIRNFVFLPVRVEGSSMMSNLHDSEVMLVTRFVRYAEAIDRGDVVILIPPVYGEQSGKYYVKRVIGLPGDKLRIESGVVFINGEPLDESAYIPFQWYGDYDEITVPQGEYFVMGDNRNHSDDSRNPRIGTITKSRIEGKTVAVMWPFSNWRGMTSGGLYD